MKIFVAIEANNKELDNLENDIEYIFIDTLLFINRNLISNLPTTLKSIHINNFNLSVRDIGTEEYFNALLQIRLPFGCELFYNAESSVYIKRKEEHFELDTLHCWNDELKLSNIEIRTNISIKMRLYLNGCIYYINPLFNIF